MSGNGRYLVTGASGRLGATVVSLLAAEGAEVAALSGTRTGVVPPMPLRPAPLEPISLRPVSLADTAALDDCVRDFRPTHVLHFGGITSMAESAADPQRAQEVNVVATRVLRDAAAACEARFLLASTDMVFDGESAPYREEDPVRPTSVYAHTKVEAEARLSGASDVAVRFPLMYGAVPGPSATQFEQWSKALRAGAPQRLFIDEYRTPVSYRDAARGAVAVVRSGLCGVIHLGGPARVSRYELVAALAVSLGVTEPQLIATKRAAVAGAEPRPADLSLVSERYLQRFPQLAPAAPGL